MTYRELLSDIILHGRLDDEAYVCEWKRDQHGVVDPHKTHMPVARFSMITSELIVEVQHRRLKRKET